MERKRHADRGGLMGGGIPDSVCLCAYVHVCVFTLILVLWIFSCKDNNYVMQLHLLSLNPDSLIFFAEKIDWTKLL